MGRVLLGAALLLAVFFFASRWAINAPRLGARDAGLALTLSFANVLALYACAGLGALAVLAAIVSAARGHPWCVLAGAALAAWLPILFLAAVR